MSTSKGFTVHHRGRWTSWLSVPLPSSLYLYSSISLPLSPTHTHTLPHIYWVRAIMFLMSSCHHAFDLRQCKFICLGTVSNAGGLLCCRSCWFTLHLAKTTSMVQSVSQPFQVPVGLSDNPSVMYHHSLSIHHAHTHAQHVTSSRDFQWQLFLAGWIVWVW